MSWWDRVPEDDARLVFGRFEALGADMASIQELAEETGLTEARVEEALRKYPDVVGELELFDERGRPFYYFKAAPATLPGMWSRFLRYFTNTGS